MSKVVNSAAGNTYFGTNGSAITSQPTNNKTRATGGGTFSSEDANFSSGGGSTILVEPSGEMSVPVIATSPGYSDGFSDVGPSTGPDRDVNKTTVLRTTRTATAIKAGYWDEYNGVWTTPPTVNDDTADLGIAADNTNKLSYQSGSKVPSNTNYDR